MSDLIDDNKVKLAYRKALLLVHPDRVKNKGGGVEEVARADMIFDALKEAWAKFGG